VIFQFVSDRSRTRCGKPLATSKIGLVACDAHAQFPLNTALGFRSEGMRTIGLRASASLARFEASTPEERYWATQRFRGARVCPEAGNRPSRSFQARTSSSKQTRSRGMLWAIGTTHVRSRQFRLRGFSSDGTRFSIADEMGRYNSPQRREKIAISCSDGQRLTTFSISVTSVRRLRAEAGISKDFARHRSV